MQLFVRRFGINGKECVGVYHVSPEYTLTALKGSICECFDPELLADDSWYLSDSRGRNLEDHG